MVKNDKPSDLKFKILFVYLNNKLLLTLKKTTINFDVKFWVFSYFFIESSTFKGDQYRIKVATTVLILRGSQCS